ncbi:MAG: hypothetical protein AB1724_05850 [Thermodesulfobacteriota bacterium]
MTTLLAAFVSGLLLFNAVPHLVQGICGKPHMTPFAPRSAAWVNIVWAWVNIVAGAVLAWFFCCRQAGPAAWAAFGLGGFVISLYLAIFWSNPDARLPWHPKG